MITLRKSKDRGFADHGWLQSFHTFSFADYYDPEHMGWSVLRVINEDRIAGGRGFATHGHREMEIISYGLTGALEHKDSMNNATIIKPGEVQRMSAGTGVLHSEHNHCQDQETHFFQIWILPEKKGIEPSYGQKDFSEKIDSGNLTLVVSKNGEDHSITVNQDIRLWVAKPRADTSLPLPLLENRKGWLQLASGSLTIGNLSIEVGDGVAFEKEKNPIVKCTQDSHFLFFDLP